MADTVENILDEKTIPDPQTPYGKSKLFAENHILKNQKQNKKIYILRPCMIHGPGNQGNLNLLYQMIRKGIPYPLGNYHNQRSFLSVDNLSFIIKHFIDQHIEPGIYHLSDDQPLSTNEVIKIMGEATGQRTRIWHIPKPFIKGLAKAGDYIPVPINSEKLKKLTENYVVSNSKIRKAIGKALPLTSVEGLTKTFKSFK